VDRGAEELEIAPRMGDGALREPTTVWVVRHGDDLYIWSHRWPTGSWYQAAQQTHAGRITAGGVGKDVRFVDAGDDIRYCRRRRVSDQVPRYAGSYLEPMLRPQARATTLAQVPSGDGSAQQALTLGHDDVVGARDVEQALAAAPNRQRRRL
jgi:hypothetical protein